MEVSDDGSGVPQHSRASLALPHATSKINTFDDIYDRNRTNHTLGFRGEALYSLANVSTQLVVATRCATDTMAQKMEFARDGTLKIDSVVNLPRKVGTTVAVVGLLAALPVRRRDFERRIQHHRSRLIQTVLGYAVFSTGVKIHLMDIVVSQKKSPEKTLLTTAVNSKTVRDTVSSVLGPKFLAGMVDIEIDLTEALRDDDAGGGGRGGSGAENAATSSSSQWKITGLVASATTNKAAVRKSNNQFFAINRRPVDLPKVARLLKECFRSFGQDRAPACVLEFHLPGNAYDINLSPDKRQVLLTHEPQLLQAIQKAVTDLWSSQTDGQFQHSDSLSNLNLSQSIRSVTAQRDPDHGVHDDEDEEADGEDESVGDLMGDSSSSGSRLFDRRYAFVHDPITSVVREQSDQMRRLEYERSSPDRMQRKRRSFQPSLSTAKDAETALKSAASRQATTDCRSSETGEYRSQDEQQTQQQRSMKRFHIQVDDVDNDEDQMRNSLNTTNTHADPLPLDTTVTPSPDTYPPRLGFSSVGLAPAATRENQSNKHPLNSEHEKIQSNATTIVTAKGGMSPQERRHWQEIQAKFNRSSDDENEESSPEATELKSANLARFRASSSSANENTRSVAAAKEIAPKSYGLERFGFRAIAKEDAIKSCDKKSSKSTAHKKPGQQVSARKAASRVVSRERAEITDSSTRSKSPVARETTVSTIWNSFGNPNDLVLASMRDRMAQRDRKRKHRELTLVDGASLTEDNGDASGSAAAAGRSLNEDKVTTVSLTKDDFRNMIVIGQFNMGFILARSENGNLWILDQHASDEKYNFEKLCKETIIHEQRLIAPMPLELSPSEEACVLDHMDIFQKNGFRFQYDGEKPPRHRLSLTALPHSGARDGRKAVQYGKDDVSALCAILGGDGDCDDAAESGGTGTDGSGMYGNNAVRRYASGSHGIRSTNADRIIARLPKSIAMFASRACRGSIMIGTALSENEMAKVVERLAEVEHPWNCPHGRYGNCL